MRMVRNWNRLLREIVNVLTLKANLEEALSNLI